jgi:hypothetical protein
MNKILEIYSLIMQEHLTNVFTKKQLKDQHLQIFSKESFRIRAVFVAAIIYCYNNPSSKFSFRKLNNWLISTFSSNNFFSRIIISSKDLQPVFNQYLAKIEISNELQIATLYENLLNIESGAELDGIRISNNKNYRNKLGSYYTPMTFAKFITSKTIDKYFDQNFAFKDLSESIEIKNEKIIIEVAKKLTFVDFSCGAGNFVIEIINYFESLFSRMKIQNSVTKSLLKNIALNVTAIDVDPIALEVCKLNLLIRVGITEQYNKISKNFVHGNFLLHTINEKNSEDKVEVFAKGFIYHDALSINLSRFNSFDVCLGNPPWEKIRFEEKAFFSLYLNQIANNHVKKSRDIEVRKFKEINYDSAIYLKQYQSEIDLAKEKIKKNKFFLFSNKGELNTYSLFTEAALKLSANNGVVGLLLKSAIVTSQINKDLFKSFISSKRLVGVYDFINRRKIFMIDSRERFCFLLLGVESSEEFSLAMNLSQLEEISKNVIKMKYKTLKLINPLTGLLPNVSAKDQLEILIKISKKFPIFNKRFSNVKFGRIVHLTLHSNFITRQPGAGKLPIYEGKFLHQFDSKYSGFNGVPYEKRYRNKSSAILIAKEDKLRADYFPESRFYIPEYTWRILSKNYNSDFMLGWRSLTSATNSRTCIATILPFIPATQSVQFLTTNNNDIIYLCGLFNSLIFDFLLKMKLNGIDLTKTVINQIPVPQITTEEELLEVEGSKISVRNLIEYFVYLLLRNDSNLKSLFLNQELIDDKHKLISRSDLIRILDLLFFYLYNLSEHDIDFVLLNFKDYSQEDKNWFIEKLVELRSNKSICL